MNIEDYFAFLAPDDIRIKDSPFAKHLRALKEQRERYSTDE